MTPNCDTCLNRNTSKCATCSAYEGIKYERDESVPDAAINVTVHNDDKWIEGYWEHIDSKPIYIHNKKQLFEECSKRGHLPKAFMKPRSQGPGYEFKWR